MHESARLSLTSMSIVKPCATIIASVQPSRDAASSSSARRRVASGWRLRLCVGIRRKSATSKARGNHHTAETKARMRPPRPLRAPPRLAIRRGGSLGKLGPTLTEEGLGHVVVADPAHGFGVACGLPEAATDGLPVHQCSHGHECARPCMAADRHAVPIPARCGCAARASQRPETPDQR
jgi:hypothetical protein